MSNINGFPKDFLWGGAIAACQAEGAYDLDGRGLSTSDIHAYEKNLDRKKSDKEGGGTLRGIQEAMLNQEDFFPKRFGIDFYHTYENDLSLLSEMGFKCFRTSISWSRIFPNGDEELPNEKGLEFYDRLIDSIIYYGMEPILTMSHYDIPLNIVTKYGGFANPKTIQFFRNFAEVLLNRYSSKVKYWIVFNQVNLVPIVQFGSLGIYDNQSEDMTSLMYQAVHNQFIAAAHAYEYGKKLNKNLQIGTMVSDYTCYPATCDPKDVVLTMKMNRLHQYYFSDVQIRGKYPEYILRYFKENGINLSISEQDIELLDRNRMDFLAVAYYATKVVDSKKNKLNPFDASQNQFLEPTPWDWRMDPLGFYNCLSQYWDRYQVPLLIAENGFGAIDEVVNGEIHDDYRIDYYRKHIEQLRECIKDGVEIIAYCAWGPIDIVSSSTAEMSKRYGFIYVDQDDFGQGTKQRMKKDSFYWYKKVIESNGEDLN